MRSLLTQIAQRGNLPNRNETTISSRIRQFKLTNSDTIPYQTFKRIIKRYLYDCNGAEWYQLDLLTLTGMKDHAPPIPVSINMNNRDETINWLRARKEPWLNNDKEIEIALKDGQDFVNVKCGEEIIAYSRIERSIAYIGYFENKINLPRGVAFIGHIYVNENYRRKGIGEYLMTKVIEELKSRGIEKLGLHVATWNIPMANMLEGMRFKKIAYIRYVKIFGKIRFWVIKSTESKRLQLRLSVPEICHSNQVIPVSNSSPL